MWYLSPEPVHDGKGPASWPSPALRFWLGGPAGGGRSVGRKNVDVRLKGSSVSRTHAMFSVQASSFYSEQRPGMKPTAVSVIDSSAYGTFVKKGEDFHRRLDKGVVVQLEQDDRVAFGSPSVWLRLRWLPLKIWARKEDRSRIQEKAELAGIQVVYKFVNGVTHVVVDKVDLSQNFILEAVVKGLKIVTLAWVNAVASMVERACKTISATKNESVAKTACAIPNESLYMPHFCEQDVATYSEATLDAALVANPVRETIFTGMTIAFNNSKRRAHWDGIIELCGGRTVMASRIGKKNAIFVRTLKESSRQSPVDAAHHVDEVDLVKAVVLADASGLQSYESDDDVPTTDQKGTSLKEKHLVESDAETGEDGSEEEHEKPEPTPGKGQDHHAADGVITNRQFSVKGKKRSADEAGLAEDSPKMPQITKRARLEHAEEEDLQMRLEINPVEYMEADSPCVQRKAEVTQQGVVDVRPFFNKSARRIPEVKLVDAPYIE